MKTSHRRRRIAFAVVAVSAAAVDMLSSGLRRLGFLILVMGLTAPTWSTCQAAGSFQTKPAFTGMVRSEDSDLAAANTWPYLSPSYLVGGCGKGRVSEPQTHICQGPADIR
jgi:hypothetical protein